MSIQQVYQQVSATIEPVKPTIDSFGIAVLIATLFEWLPKASALVTFIWVCLRIYESPTVQGIIARRRARE